MDCAVRHRLIVLLICGVMMGCSTTTPHIPPSAVPVLPTPSPLPATTAVATPVQNGIPIAQTTSPIELLTWYERLNQLPTAERQREIQSVVQRSQRHKGELLRLQAALGLSTLDHIEAKQRALVLLEPLLSSKTLEPSYRPLVHVLVNLLSEIEKQHQRAEEALQQFKQSQRRANALKNKLEKLKAIEHELPPLNR